MKFNFNDERPIFMQLVDQIEYGILSGVFPEESQVPSTAEISLHYGINPATSLKGINQLVDRGVLYKKRGMVIFVAPGAVELLTEKRKKDFYGAFIRKLVCEAKRLNLSQEEIVSMMDRGFKE